MRSHRKLLSATGQRIPQTAETGRVPSAEGQIRCPPLGEAADGRGLGVGASAPPIPAKVKRKKPRSGRGSCGAWAKRQALTASLPSR